jgi:hypothetical protein
MAKPPTATKPVVMNTTHSIFLDIIASIWFQEVMLPKPKTKGERRIRRGKF